MTTTRKSYIKQAIKNAPCEINHSAKYPLNPIDIKPGTRLAKKSGKSLAYMTVTKVLKETPKKIVLQVQHD